MKNDEETYNALIDAIEKLKADNKRLRENMAEVASDCERIAEEDSSVVIDAIGRKIRRLINIDWSARK